MGNASSGPEALARYSIDTCALMEAQYVLYPPDVFRPLWATLEGMARNGVLVASEEVYQELQPARWAELKAWADGVRTMFKQTDSAVMAAVQRILAEYCDLVPANSLKSRADPFVIALAQVSGCAVVAVEKKSGSLLGPKIPDVCGALGIPVMSIAQMLRAERVAF